MSGRRSFDLKGAETDEEKMKYEIAEELGLLDKVGKYGWKSLSARETGRIGGIMAGRLKNKGNPESDEVRDLK